MSKYEVKLGINFDNSELKKVESKINNLTDNTHRIKIDFDTSRIHKQFDHIEKRFKNLTGTKSSANNIMPIDTTSLNKSLGEIAKTIGEIKKSIVGIDGGDMKPLLTSINQIATALGKATDESESLVSALNALSKKDFGFNFNFKTGNTNPAKAMSDYGRAARDEAIPALEQQVRHLQELIGGYDKADRELQNYMVKMYQLNGISKKNDLLDKAGGSGSLQEQMSALKRHVNILKEIASQKGFSLDKFNATYSKSADEIISDTNKIQSGAKQTEEALEAMGNELKQVFGTGIDGDNLSKQLEFIVDDLREIRNVFESLSNDNPLSGLTKSFNRLSEVLEQVTNNAELAQKILNGGLTSTSGVNNKNALDNIVDSQKAVSDAQHAGQEIGNTLNKSIQQTMDVGSVTDKYVLDLMENYGIAGKKGSKAFEEIRQAVVNYRRELSGLDDTSDEFTNVSGLRQITSALASHIKEVDEAKSGYADLVKYIKDVNNSGAKIHLPDSIKQEYGGDFRSMRSSLGKAFTTGQGQDFEGWVEELNSVLGHTIDLSNGAEAAFGDLVAKINSAKGSKFVSGDDLFRQGYLDIDEMEADIITSLGRIEQEEQEAVLAANNAANNIAKSEAIKQRAYQQTANEYRRIRTEASLENIENLDIGLAELGFDNKSIQAITRDIDDLGITVKRVTTSLNDDGSIKLTVKGIDDAERAVTAVKKVRQVIKDGVSDIVISGGTTITQDFDEAEQAYKRMLSLAKEMGSIDAKLTTLDTSKNANEIKELTIQFEKLEDEYIELDNTFGKKLSSDQLLNLNREFDNTTNKLEQIKARLNDAFEMDKAAKEIRDQEAAFKELFSVLKQMDSLKVKIEGLDSSKNAGEINELISQLNRLEVEFNELYAKTDRNFSIDQTNAFEKQLVDTANKIQLVKAKLADARAEMARKIKIGIEIGDFDNSIQKIETKYNNLSKKLPEVAYGINEVKQALRDMNAASDNNNDEELINAKQRYEKALKQVGNQLEENIRLEKETVTAQKLADDKTALSNKIDAWLTKNSAAVKKFGSRMQELKAQIQSCDAVQLDHLKKEFDGIDKEAEAAGVKAKSLGDRLRTQFSKYSTYFSAASVFMYVEQGLRDMFQQVVAIDTAMTELKKVTDETSATYNQFLTNAGQRASAIGTTVDGLVTSTADFARLGYEFGEAANLAEVANIYTVVGDEIDSVDTATQSVISTMKAFKVEASDSMSIVDKFNEVSNNFAISSGGIGEALTRSASSLAAANNDLDESIALITASNSVVQDPTVVGTALKTISMRIRGAKTE